MMVQILNALFEVCFNQISRCIYIFRTTFLSTKSTVSKGCLASAVLTHSPLPAATRVRYLASACEMVMQSPSQTDGFPPGTPVSYHTKTIRTLYIEYTVDSVSLHCTLNTQSILSLCIAISAGFDSNVQDRARRVYEIFTHERLEDNT